MDQVRLIKMNDFKQALIAFVNTALVEDTFNNITNSYQEFLDVVKIQGVRPGVYPQVLIATQPTADMIAVYGNGLSLDDLVITLAFDQGVPEQELRGDERLAQFVGMIVEGAMMNFLQLSPFTLSLLHFRSLSPSGIEPSMTRNITVTPTGGVNTSFQFAVFPIGVNQNLNPQAPYEVSPGVFVPMWTSQDRGQFSFISPTPIKKSQTVPSNIDGSYSSVLVVFKGLGQYGLDKLQVKLTPIFAHTQAPMILEEMFDTLGSAFTSN